MESLSHYAWHFDREGKIPARPLSHLFKGPNQDYPGPLCVDAVEPLLNRLYLMHRNPERPGDDLDWLCGGQWRQLEANLAALCLQGPLHFVFDGSSGDSWGGALISRGGPGRREKNRGFSSPPPLGLRDFIRLMALAHGASVSQSARDHRLAVARYCRRLRCPALLAQHGDFLVFRPPRLLSAASLRTVQRWRSDFGCDGCVCGSCPVIVAQACRSPLAELVGVVPERLPLVASLIGNHLLSAASLSPFHRRLLHKGCSITQLRDVIVAVAEFVCRVPDPSDLDAIVKQVFGESNQFARNLALLRASLGYYRTGQDILDGNGERGHRSHIGYRDRGDWGSGDGDRGVGYRGYGYCGGKGSSDGGGGGYRRVGYREDDDRGDGYRGVGYRGDGYHGNVALGGPLAPPSFMREVERLHQRGEIHTTLLHLVTKGEVWLPPEDTRPTQGIPKATRLYQTARQHVYGLLFLHGPPVLVKEWSPVGMLRVMHLVAPLAPPGDHAHPMELWRAGGPEGSARRLEALLACLHCEDAPGLRRHGSRVPKHLLLLCCVLRYLLQWEDGRLLSRQELNAFLAQAVMLPYLSPGQLCDTKVPELSARGAALAVLFIRGVETALIANDACGHPVPHECTSPANYFDGKLFQRKLMDAEEQTLLQLCDGKDLLAAYALELRRCTVEGLRLPPPSLCNLSCGAAPSLPPLDTDEKQTIALPAGTSMWAPQRAGRACGARSSVPIGGSAGGRLQVAGVTVAKWAGRFGDGPGREEGVEERLPIPRGPAWSRRPRGTERAQPTLPAPAASPATETGPRSTTAVSNTGFYL